MLEPLFVSAAEAAFMLGGISKASVYKLVSQDRLAHMRVGRRVLISRASIIRLAEIVENRDNDN